MVRSPKNEILQRSKMKAITSCQGSVQITSFAIDLNLRPISSPKQCQEHEERKLNRLSRDRKRKRGDAYHDRGTTSKQAKINQMGKDKKGKDCHKTDKLAPMDNCASNSSLTKGTKKRGASRCSNCRSMHHSAMTCPEPYRKRAAGSKSASKAPQPTSSCEVDATYALFQM